MNFFAHQDQARRQTRRMLLLFALAVIAIVAAVDFVLVVALGLGDARHTNGQGSWGGLFVVSVFVLIVIGLGSLYRIATLRGGGAVVARELGGMPVPTDTGNFAYRRLRNVVEEIAIAAGVPVPEIFVLEDEAGINAFASGYAPTDAAVTVTRGALDKLTREELQGVIGHEFSHILNGDMRLNIRLMGVVFGILVLATIGRKIAELSGRGRDRDSGGAVMFGLALLAVGYIGVVFARMIKASISRQREFLADASAVQFTRQTEGIAGALKKIGGLAEGSKLASSDKEEVAHMLFGDGVGYSALFATHPPLDERIRRLDPSFHTEQFAAIATAWAQPTLVGEDGADRADVSIAGFAPAFATPSGRASTGAALPAADTQLRVSPKAVVRQVGNPGNDDRAAARSLHAAIPEPLRQAAWQAGQAMPLVFALLLNVEADTRARQLDRVVAHYDAGTRALVEALAAQLADLHPMQRLPLAALAFPALRRRPRPQLTTFMIVLRELIDADGRVTLEEYCLATLIRVQVMEALNPAATQVIGRTRLPEVAAELKDLLAIVAQYGHDDSAPAQRAYALGLHAVLPDAAITYAPPSEWALALDRALPRLDLLAPAGKELVVGALTLAISADGIVSVAESELLRTVCAALHCPLPPLLQRFA
ncbi:M48 family metallopeptidase [Dokdonella soli]|uniref:M48 family metallopeptidase n=1 Tax=Dokdonella soli TaxID=529810 RepID=A0ABN1IP96_9GAMM